MFNINEYNNPINELPDELFCNIFSCVGNITFIFKNKSKLTLKTVYDDENYPNGCIMIYYQKYKVLGKKNIKIKEKGKMETLNITVDSNGSIILSKGEEILVFGSISVDDCYVGGVYNREKSFDQLNNYYDKLIVTSPDALSEIFKLYKDLHHTLLNSADYKTNGTSLQNIKDCYLSEMITKLLNQHHYTETLENLFDFNYLKPVSDVYEVEPNEVGLSLTEYFTLAELSLVVKILVPIRSFCDNLFEEEEDFTFIEKVLVDCIKKSLFYSPRIHNLLLKMVSDRCYYDLESEEKDIYDIYLHDIYLSVLPFIDVTDFSNTLLEEISYISGKIIFKYINNLC